MGRRNRDKRQGDRKEKKQKGELINQSMTYLFGDDDERQITLAYIRLCENAMVHQ